MSLNVPAFGAVSMAKPIASAKMPSMSKPGDAVAKLPQMEADMVSFSAKAPKAADDSAFENKNSPAMSNVKFMDLTAKRNVAQNPDLGGFFKLSLQRSA
jgi:hypothetical protein